MASRRSKMPGCDGSISLEDRLFLDSLFPSRMVEDSVAQVLILICHARTRFSVSDQAVLGVMVLLKQNKHF
jgi:hypothetical protein